MFFSVEGTLDKELGAIPTPYPSPREGSRKALHKAYKTYKSYMTYKP